MNFAEYNLYQIKTSSPHYFSQISTCIEGILSKSLSHFENSISSRVSFTESRGLDLSYIMIVNLSSFWEFSEETVIFWKGWVAVSSKAGVTTLFNSHTRHGDFFPIPQNCEVQSHPVKAWKTGRVRDLDSPRAEQIPLMLITEKWRPMPNATHTLESWL